MGQPLPAVEAPKPIGPVGPAIEDQIKDWGRRIFAWMNAAERGSLFRRRNFSRALMDWALQNPKLKTQLFRLVDVLPSLGRSGDVSRYLDEYLAEQPVSIPAALRVALGISRRAPWLVGVVARQQVTSLGRQFMLPDHPKELLASLRRRHSHGIGFTVDLLGEMVVSEPEADRYAARCLDLLRLLASEAPHWIGSNATPVAPVVNLSVKVSALYSQISTADPETAIERISERLRPILRQAKDIGALVNFDMEQYALKDLTLCLFKRIFAEPEFADRPPCGLALQAYLRDSEADLQDLLEWCKTGGRRITIRLVKGAYWDYEQVIAQQKGWPVPVFTEKADTDANYEKLSLMLLESETVAETAFGTHNVRSIAHALAQASRLGVPPRHFEFQLLYGMADSTKTALVNLGQRVREYCPVGQLLPGMAYLVRRLLENTSNEGFLARRRIKPESVDELLESPGEAPQTSSFQPTIRLAENLPPPSRFANEPHTDWTDPGKREGFRAALKSARSTLGQRHSLIINNEPLATADWLPSLNPANQDEVIGYAAQGGISHAEAAVAAAQAAGPAWARTSVERRAFMIETAAQLLRRDRFELAALEVLEAGKNWSEADADVAEAIDFCNFYAAVIRDMGAPQLTQRVLGEANQQHWWPRGTALVIAPWNFPLAILTGMTVAALVSGNAVIIKPSDQTPVLGARLTSVLLRAGFEPGVVNLIMGQGSTVGAHLVGHPKVDLIAFTGSKEVGLRIWEAAGRTLPGQAGPKKVVCEMGGKNAVIVDSDADLDEAVVGIVASAFGYQGQKCSALSRLIVLVDKWDELLTRLQAATAGLRVGPAEEPGTVIGPVISREAQQRILGMIEAGKTEARLFCQAAVPAAPSACYVPPTIFTHVPRESRLFREEIFGPVLSVTRASDFTEALALANGTEFALTGGLYSRRPSHIARAKAEFACGNLYINRPITGALVERQPFGGFKMSGAGTKAGGREYLQNFMVPRVVTENCSRRGFALEEE